MEKDKLKFKPIWSILCQQQSVDSVSNNMSLFNILEEVRFELNMEEVDKLKYTPGFDPSLPITLPFNSYLVILWKNYSNNPTLGFTVKIVMKDPKEKILRETTQEINFQANKVRLRSIFNLAGMPLTEPGEYIYSIMAKNENGEFEELDYIPLNVKIDLKRK